MSKLPSTSCRERTPLRSEKDPQAKLLHRRLLRSLALGSLKLLATGTPSCVARLTALCTAIWAATASRTSIHGAIDLPTTTTTAAAAACATPFFRAPLSLSSRTINARIMASSSLCCLGFLGLRRWALFFLGPTNESLKADCASGLAVSTSLGSTCQAGKLGSRVKGNYQDAVLRYRSINTYGPISSTQILRYERFLF